MQTIIPYSNNNHSLQQIKFPSKTERQISLIRSKQTEPRYRSSFSAEEWVRYLKDGTLLILKHQTQDVITYSPPQSHPKSALFSYFYGLCRPEIFTGSHCFSLDPFSSVRLLQLGIIRYCISSILRWDITKHRAHTQLIRLWKRKDGNQLQVPQSEHNNNNKGPTSLGGTGSCCPLPVDHQPQPLCTHSTASVGAFQQALVLACWTIPRMNLSGCWKALHKLGLISSYTASSAWRHHLKEHIKGWIWLFFLNC